VPELPEVEVTRRQLEPLLVGRRIVAVAATAASRFFVTPPASLRRRLSGRLVLGLDRIGKYLLVRLDSGERLLLHLGMTGQIFGAGAASVRLMRKAASASLPPERQTAGFSGDRHTHLRLRFEDGSPDVLFRDVRRFGRVQLLRAGEAPQRLARLGPDALQVRGDRLRAAIHRRGARIKAVLLDQAVLAGVGNIYADEALFLAGVRPTRRGRSLRAEECRRLALALRRVLRRAIATGGSSISDFVRPDGTDGAYQDERRVYGRTGEPCLRCGTSIRRLVIGGRSSHFCPRCQR